MAGFLKSSIGKKVVMSLSGVFLIMFLAVHLTINLLTLVGSDTFNAAAHFMGTNPAMKILELVLALGFLFHILYSIVLTIGNMKARPVRYKVATSGISSTWASRNMFVLGAVILLFLVLHLTNYYIKFKFTDLIESGKATEYDVVVALFSVKNWYYVLIYIVWFIFLVLNLNNALRSALHTIGLNNKVWECRLKRLSALYAIVITIGFTSIPVYFLLQELL